MSDWLQKYGDPAETRPERASMVRIAAAELIGRLLRGQSPVTANAPNGEKIHGYIDEDGDITIEIEGWE